MQKNSSQPVAVIGAVTMVPPLLKFRRNPRIHFYTFDEAESFFAAAKTPADMRKSLQASTVIPHYLVSEELLEGLKGNPYLEIPRGLLFSLDMPPETLDTWTEAVAAWLDDYFREETVSESTAEDVDETESADVDQELGRIMRAAKAVLMPVDIPEKVQAEELIPPRTLRKKLTG